MVALLHRETLGFYSPRIRFRLQQRQGLHAKPFHPNRAGRLLDHKPCSATGQNYWSVVAPEHHPANDPIALTPFHSLISAWPDGNQRLPDQGVEFANGSGSGCKGRFWRACVDITRTIAIPDSARARNGFPKQQDRSQSHKQLPTLQNKGRGGRNTRLLIQCPPEQRVKNSASCRFPK